MNFINKILNSKGEDDSPYEVNKKVKEFEKKWFPLLDKKFPGNKMDSWEELEKIVAESANDMSMEDENISSFYNFESDATTFYLSRAERLKLLLESFKDKKPVFHDRERVLANMFPEYQEDEQNSNKHIKHENDYFAAKTPKELLNFIIRTVRENKGKKILIVTMPDKFADGTRKTLESKLSHKIGSDPDHLDDKKIDVVACDIKPISKYFRSFKVPDIIINLDVCYDVSAFLNRMLLKRAEEEVFKCTIFHAGSGIVHILEEHFG